ncbi:hypothetical protein H0H87_010645, partial [Tephrocybe sp. NHM501043]
SPGAPTPSGLSRTLVLGGELNLTNVSNSSDDGWGWQVNMNNNKEIQNHFQKISTKTGCSLITLHAKFYDCHSASSLQLDWQVYEDYFKLNKEMEQEQHRDEDRNKVPDATVAGIYGTSTEEFIGFAKTQA